MLRSLLVFALVVGTITFADAFTPSLLPQRLLGRARSGWGRCKGRKSAILAAEKRVDGKEPIYLDYSGTTPVDEAVIDAMLPYFREGWGNPSSSHAFGRAAKEGLAEARRQVAASIGSHPFQYN